jgi:Flp pilus assembly protein TadG
MRMLRKHPQKGMAIAMVALCIVVLFLMAALAVDLGVLYTARTSAQHAADAAALAGAYTFLRPTAPQPSTAQNAAVATAAANAILGTPVAITTGNVTVDTATRRVTVTVPRTSAGGNAIGTFFARVANNTSADIVAKATAEAGLQGSASRCVKPIFLPNTIFSDLTPGAGNSACNAGQVVFDSSGNITAWAQGLFGVQKTIRPVDPNTALQPGQFYSLDFGSGGSTYRCAWGQCLNYCAGTSEIACGQRYPVETGNMVGPTQQGVRDLIGNPADRWIGIDQYDVDGVTMDTSKSLVIAPVWEDCDPANQIISGTRGQTVAVIGFLELFVDRYQNGNGPGSGVQAHIVRAVACPRNGGGGGGGGAGNPNPSTGPMATPVRLIQTQS